MPGDPLQGEIIVARRFASVNSSGDHRLFEIGFTAERVNRVLVGAEGLEPPTFAL
jgi:hypothetical protein